MAEINWAQVVPLVFMAFACEYVDSSLGMGYGTTLTPILLLMGFQPLQVVPAVLLSEFVTGVVAGGMHHLVGNVNFTRKSDDTKTVVILSGAGVVGVLLAVSFTLSVSPKVVKIYIGLMLLAMGGLMWWRRKYTHHFSWKRILGLGLVSAFNKGISGGGYGPLVTGGQILVGRKGKSAVGSTSLAEGIVCLAGLIFYAIGKGLPAPAIVIPLTVGAVLSTPAAVLTTQRLATKNALKETIAILVIIMALLTLYRVFL